MQTLVPCFSVRVVFGILFVLSQICVYANDIPLQSAVVTHNQDGRLEVFGTGSDGILYDRWQSTTRTGALAWGEWEINFIGHARDVRAARASSGELVAVFLDDGRVSVRHQSGPNGGWEGETRKLGLPKLELQLGRNEDGRLEIVTLEPNHTVTTFPQVQGGSIDWQDPRGLGGANLHAIAVAQDGTGRMTIAGLTPLGSVQVIQQTVPNGAWGSWSSLDGHALSRIVMTSDAFGTLHLFARGDDGRVYRRSQSGSTWSAWTGMGQQMVMSIRAVTTPGGFVRVLGNDWGGQLMSIGQVRRPLTKTVSWQRDWVVVDGTTRSELLWDAIWDDSGSVLGGYGPQAGAVRLLTTKDSVWDTSNWVDLKEPPANTPPDLRLQLPCCLNSCPSIGGFDWSTLPALLVDSLTKGTRGTDLAPLVSNPGAIAACVGSPALGTVGIWLNRSPSIQALRSMPQVDADDPAEIALSISQQTFVELVDTRLPHLPNRFNDKLKPRRDGEVRIDSYGLDISNENDASCGGSHVARIGLSINGSVTMDSWGLGILNASFQAKPRLDLCADLHTMTMRCNAATSIDSSTGNAISALAAMFAPWVANVAIPGTISNVISGEESTVTSGLGSCSIGDALPTRIPIAAAAGATPQSLVIPYNSAIGQPGLGVLIHAGIPIPKDRSPSIIWTSTSKPIEAGANNALRKIVIRFKFNDMRGLEDPDVLLSSTAPGSSVENVTVSGATISYSAPVDDDPHNAYLSRVAIYAKDRDGLELRADTLVKLAR